MIVACDGERKPDGLFYDVLYKPVAVFDNLEEAEKKLDAAGFVKFVGTTYFRTTAYPAPQVLELFEIVNDLF